MPFWLLSVLLGGTAAATAWLSRKCKVDGKTFSLQGGLSHDWND